MPVPALSSSNNTNKLSPQELLEFLAVKPFVQIIQINLVLKNVPRLSFLSFSVQIIQINLVLKNANNTESVMVLVQIIQINLVLKNTLASCEPTFWFK